MEKFARVKNGVVENIEMATPEWVAENQGVDGFQFVVVSENDRPWVGYSYDSETGKFDGPIGCCDDNSVI